MKVRRYLVLLAAIPMLLVGCVSAPPSPAVKVQPAAVSAPPQAITVTATEMAFSPTTFEARVGQPVTLTLRNNGVLEHNWQAKIGAETILVTVPPKQEASKTFTPSAAGTYKVICTVPGHEMAGMVATLVVK